MQISLNLAAVDKAIERAFKDATLIMDGEFKKAISDPIYPWPKGETPRDVVDTGRLRNSQEYSYSYKTARYTWPTEYAAAVHNGYLTRGKTAMPARPWTDKALAKKDLNAVAQRLLNAYL